MRTFKSAIKKAYDSISQSDLLGWFKHAGYQIEHLGNCCNRTYREDILDMYMFGSLTEVREISKQWLKQYNNERPHESLNGLTPVLFANKQAYRAA